MASLQLQHIIGPTMKFAIIIFILTCGSKLSIASNDYVAPEFENHVDDSKLHCEDDLLSLNFSNAVITEIGKDFISSHLITCLDLSNNHIESIANGAFSKLPKLTKLYLSNNKFISPQDLFTLGNQKTLEVLTLNNAIQRLYSRQGEITGSYPNLEILSMRENGFYDIIASTRAPFPKLKTLDLSGNYMSDTKFVDLLPATLEHLYLQSNSLIIFSLKNGKNVTTLTLDNNRLGYISAYSGLWLSTMNNLRYLSVTGNNIEYVESTAFDDPSNLIYLNLSRNKIQTLYPETFVKLQSLRTLDLSSNKFEKIIDISVVMNITFLSLSCNRIQDVPAHIFKTMPELQELSLSRNQIENVDVNGFAYLYHLEKLDLSNNKLSFMPEGWANAFDSLQFLDLCENQFTSLESLCLSNTLPLVEMYLAKNPLKYLGSTSFNSLPKNVTVNLEHGLHENVTTCEE